MDKKREVFPALPYLPDIPAKAVRLEPDNKKRKLWK